MYKTTVEAVSGLKVRAGGKWLTCIGNRAVKVGDRIWTDGRCAYGHDRETQAPIVIASPTKDDLAIPLLFFDKAPTSKSQAISETRCTLLTKSSIEMNVQGTTARSVVQDVFMINNQSNCYFLPVAQNISFSRGIEQIATVAINLDKNHNTYEIKKSRLDDNVSVSVLKNGQLLEKIDFAQKIKSLRSELTAFARSKIGGSVVIPKERWRIIYDPNSTSYYLADDVTGVPIEIARASSGLAGALVPGSPQKYTYYERMDARSSSGVTDFGVPWGLIENEQSWAFIFSVYAYCSATGYRASGDSAALETARVYARRSYLCTPSGAKELCYSLKGDISSGGQEYTPKIQRSFPVSDLIPIQDGYHFAVNATKIHLDKSAQQNAVTMNISICDGGDRILWTGVITAGTYLTICKHKGLWLGLDDRGGFGLVDREFNSSSYNYGQAFGDVESGLYLIQNGQLIQILSGYLKNQKLRPMKRYKNWWERVQLLE